ncbi:MULTISPECIES: flagellar FlbT [Acidocella]|uniref:flagellar FlbT n=1 Tax=Acidocella TaxID=50709 RepID=UPI00028BF28E|nr:MULTISPECIES: flagellar FlbT [Acidocella]EKN01167.1 putative flagellar FlbT [Acidocella sp. MX-AZ02]WBO60707.1 flagellar biosynthesis repressor FlbT [Acidocella sp. MX-AZ03]
MSSLVLELKQGESMILNGAVIRFKTRTRLELNSHARFLFGKQIMPAEEATSPLRQAYFALQQAYISDEEERPEALQRARDNIRRLMGEAPEAQREDWSALLRLTSEETVLDALKRARQMIRAAESAPQGN